MDVLGELDFAWRYTGNELLVCLSISAGVKGILMGKTHLEMLDRLDGKLHLDLLKVPSGLCVE
jgi:hypothetical protein